MTKFEILAQELETVARGQKIDLSRVIGHARDENFSKNELIMELKNERLNFFAKKLESGYYEKQWETLKNG